MGKLVARGAGTLAMGILNPLLAILPLLEEGKGKDSNCGALIAQANASSKKKPAAPTASQRSKNPRRPLFKGIGRRRGDRGAASRQITFFHN